VAGDVCGWGSVVASAGYSLEYLITTARKVLVAPVMKEDPGTKKANLYGEIAAARIAW